MEARHLKTPFLYSALAHLTALLLIAFFPAFPVFEPKLKVVWVELPRGISETADLKLKEAKDLPKTTLQEQKQAVEEPKKKEEKPMTLPPAKPKSKSKPKTLSPEEKKIKEALAKIDKRLKQKPAEAAQIKDKGEGFQYGTGTEPSRISPGDPEVIAYQAKIRAKIMEEWVLPPSYLEGPSPPKARLFVLIDQAGTIVSTVWETKSGNPSFDISCLRAVQRASPLPIPPAKLQWEAFHEGFIVDFDPTLKEKIGN